MSVEMPEKEGWAYLIVIGGGVFGWMLWGISPWGMLPWWLRLFFLIMSAFFFWLGTEKRLTGADEETRKKWKSGIVFSSILGALFILISGKVLTPPTKGETEAPPPEITTTVPPEITTTVPPIDHRTNIGISPNSGEMEVADFVAWIL